MNSKFLSSLSREEYNNLKKELLRNQGGKCFICGDVIDIDLQQTDIDHIIPLKLGGKDRRSNFAITHHTCNRQKQDQNLEVARVIARYEKIKENVFKTENRSPDLSDILEIIRGNGFELSLKIDKNNNKIFYSFPEINDNNIYKSSIYNDEISGFRSFFINLPIEYLFHDEKGINPRPLSENIKKLIKEFYNKHPQLQIGLGRIELKNEKEKTKVFIFDGQHKSAASILLGNRHILLRVFINPNLEILAQTNEKAGTTLKQISFDKSVQRQLGSTILSWKIEKFQQAKKLEPDNLAFSEKDLVDFYRGEAREVKTFILDSVRRRIIDHSDNKLVGFINFGGREKEKPLSYSSIEKTFFSIFLSQDILDIRPFLSTERDLEIRQIVQLMSLIAEKVYKDYDFSVGTYKIEDKIRAEQTGKHSTIITDNQLRIVRMSKEEIMFNWLNLIKQVITFNFGVNGIIFNQKAIMQKALGENAWSAIGTFIDNLIDLPLWVDRQKTHIFSAKQPQSYWFQVFSRGKTPDNVDILSEPINLQEMIRPKK